MEPNLRTFMSIAAWIVYFVCTAITREIGSWPVSAPMSCRADSSRLTIESSVIV